MLLWTSAALVGPAIALQTLLGEALYATRLLSQQTWSRWMLGVVDLERTTAPVSFWSMLLVVAMPVALVGWLAAGRAPAASREGAVDGVVRKLGQLGLLPLAWAVLAIGGLLVMVATEGVVARVASQAAGFALYVTPLVVAIWLAGLLWLACPWDRWLASRWSRLLWLVPPVFVVTSILVQSLMWRAMTIPHIDSAMYEEHLWNTLHGKGFRSFLDQGLFLGEHVQVIHLLLLPVYAVAPHHLTLEVCETLALAATLLPLVGLARHFGWSPAGQAALAAAACLYVPLHTLDVAADQTTFRPNTFGVPLLLWALWAIETRRWRQAALALLLTLACKEDYTLVVAPLGVWIAAQAWRQHRAGRVAATPNETATSWRRLPRGVWMGLALAAAATAYLFVAVVAVIPAFRSGKQTHFSADYYPQLGDSTGEIVKTCLLQPWIPAADVFGATGLAYALFLLVPLAGLPLLSPSRLAVLFPALAITVLNRFTLALPMPVLRFHAPLVPVLFWAMTAAPDGDLATLLRRLPTAWPKRWADWIAARSREQWAAAAVLASATTLVLIGTSPVSLAFYDPGRDAHWRRTLVPGPRVASWQRVEPLLPREARVAATNLVRPRLTHHRRAYDYSSYPRAVANYEDRVPADTDFIVVDRTELGSPLPPGRPVAELRELAREPQRWEVLFDDGTLVVLKRRP